MNTPKILSQRIGLRGRVYVSIVNPVRGNRECGMTPNLILDQGLDKIAEVSICDIFRVGVKGTGSTATKEVVPGANNFTVNSGSTTITRVAGTRDFTADDVGRLVKFVTGGWEMTITAFTDATHVEAEPAPLANIVADDIVLYYVEQVGLDAETGRTVEYSGAVNENKTTTVGALRTFLRTFLFEGENTLVTTPSFSNFYTQAGTTVTRTQGTRDFTLGDVGKTIRYRDTQWTAEIVSFTDATHVEVDVAMTVTEQCIDILEENAMSEVPDVANTYSRAGNTVTRTAGTRDFTADDVGKIIHFITSNVEAKITAFTDATHVDVNDNGALAAQNIELYGFNDYEEIGFSHTEETGDNLNIRVKLAAPVRVNGASRLSPSDQLKVAYELDLTVSPSAETVGTLSGVIIDPGNQMSGNKNGKYAIEGFATSVVTASGETDLSFAFLEPSMPGYLALSLNDDALSPLLSPVRNEGVAYTPFEAADYSPGDFFRTYTGTFGLNDAVSNNWRSLMLYDADTENAIFTFLFNASQKKDSEHTLTVSLTKTWGRDLA